MAQLQRRLQWYFLGFFGVQIGSFVAACVAARSIEWIGIVTFLVLMQVTLTVGVMQLETAMRTHIVVRALGFLLMLSPCVNLVVLIVVDNRARSMLRRVGLNVGLFGVADAVVVRKLGTNTCRQCSYSLIGNRSGVCPECGEPTGAVGRRGSPRKGNRTQVGPDAS